MRRSIQSMTRALLVAFATLATPLAARAAEPLVVQIDATEIERLERRLDAVAATLPPAELATWQLVLTRAASVAPDRRGLAVARVFTPAEPPAELRRPRGPSDAPEDDGLAVIEGGLRRGLGDRGLIGPKPEDPHALISPKPEDPHALISPKPEDPQPRPDLLAPRLRDLSATLGADDRAILDWLLARAARAVATVGRPARPGTPGGADPVRLTLTAALGVAALIGPKPEDPGAPAAAPSWELTL